MSFKILLVNFLMFSFCLVECKADSVSDIKTLENNGCCTEGESNFSGNPQNVISLMPQRSDKPSEFPPDLFPEEALRKGAVLLHLIGALYSFGIIGIVCGDYFLPSIDCICCDLNLSQDVAAATFMSFATTAPELFVILIATFITKSDIGVGAVVGSGMFNILGVATVGGLAAITPIKLDWWPLFRDSLVYVLAPVGLAIVVADGWVTLFEAICLIVYYFIYFGIMFYNRQIRKKVKNVIKKFKGENKKENKLAKINVPTISLTLDDTNSKNNSTDLAENNANVEENENFDYEGTFKAYFMNYDDSISLRRTSASSVGSGRSNKSRRKSNISVNDKKLGRLEEITPNQLPVCDNVSIKVTNDSLDANKTKEKEPYPNKEQISDEHEEGLDFRQSFFTLPTGSCWDKFVWVILWPASFVLCCTIPNCKSGKLRKFYPLTFLMCVFWIGSSSYFGTWMFSVLGDTIGISDSVMGLTFLALGGSMPEAISTYIMARQGEGGLGFSNSLGGNTMDICLCLGLPWLINCAMHGPVQIQSEGLQYNSIALLFGVLVLLSISVHTKFHMNKRMGIVCCTFYLIFIVVSVMIELSVISTGPKG